MFLVTKTKVIYIAGCSPIIHYFGVESIPTFGRNLIVVVIKKMLKWDAIPKTTA